MLQKKNVRTYSPRTHYFFLPFLSKPWQHPLTRWRDALHVLCRWAPRLWAAAWNRREMGRAPVPALRPARNGETAAPFPHSWVRPHGVAHCSAVDLPRRQALPDLPWLVSLLFKDKWNTGAVCAEGAEVMVRVRFLCKLSFMAAQHCSWNPARFSPSCIRKINHRRKKKMCVIIFRQSGREAAAKRVAQALWGRRFQLAVHFFGVVASAQTYTFALYFLAWGIKHRIKLLENYVCSTWLQYT